MRELLPCPFCGSAATLEADFGRDFWVQCEQGHSHGILDNNPNDAESSWNRRAAHEAARPPTSGSESSGGLSADMPKRATE